MQVKWPKHKLSLCDMLVEGKLTFGWKPKAFANCRSATIRPDKANVQLEVVVDEITSPSTVFRTVVQGLVT